MHYHEFDPHPSLAGHILNYWEFRADEPDGDLATAVPYMHHVMPDGCVSLIYARQAGDPVAQIGLSGPHLKEVVVPVYPGALWWGVRFWPDAAGSLLPVSTSGLDGAFHAAYPLLPELCTRLHSTLDPVGEIRDALHLLDQAFIHELPGADPLDEIVRQGVERIVMAQGQLPIRDLSASLGLSERQLERRFRKATGLTPKRFARIRRFRSSVGNVLLDKPQLWTRVAADQGYADQAHMSREFSDMVGLTPTEFQKRVREIEHRDVTV